MIELLQGKFSQHIMQVITQPDKGLFPKSKEIVFDCSCPDHASMCKHVSATLYVIGIRLDESPDQLFLLRQVDQTELLLSAVKDVPFGLGSTVGANVIEDDLSQLFGIDIAETTKEQPKKVKKTDVSATKKKNVGVYKKEGEISSSALFIILDKSPGEIQGIFVRAYEFIETVLKRIHHDEYDILRLPEVG